MAKVLSSSKMFVSLRRIINSNMQGDKSFVDDLNTKRGTVSMRVCSMPRSAEVQPLVLLICYCL
jgi:hypothetical protein